MNRKIPARYRVIIFAIVMSCSTSMIVSGTIIKLHTQNFQQFMSVWPSAFFISWPIVFFAILIIAPLVNKLLNLVIEAP